MSEPHRSDIAHGEHAVAGADRDAKIEQLLLVGLDHYFASRYELAINVWTRVLFIDRSHPRARAYIDRARSALAERQRESEELLQNGVAAFQRGEGDEARRLLNAAIDGGAPSEEALVVLERLNRLETAVAPAAPRRPDRAARPGGHVPDERAPHSRLRRALIAGIGMGLVAAASYAAVKTGLEVRAIARVRPLVALTEGLTAPDPPLVAPVTREVTLVLPRRGEMIVAHARDLMASGHFRDALTALDGVRPADPQRPDADRLRADIQRQLIALATLPIVPEPAPPARPKGDRRVP